MKTAALILATALCLCAQTTAAPPAATIQNLPTTLVGLGGEWNRYALGTARFDADVSAAFQIGKTNWYSYTTISTPLEKTPAGQSPSTSSVRSGFFYVINCNSTASVCMIALGQAGINVGSGTTATASITGGMGVPFRIGKSNIYITPLLRFEPPVSNSGVDVVPEIWVSYGFGGVPK